MIEAVCLFGGFAIGYVFCLWVMGQREDIRLRCGFCGSHQFERIPNVAR